MGIVLTNRTVAKHSILPVKYFINNLQPDERITVMIRPKVGASSFKSISSTRYRKDYGWDVFIDLGRVKTGKYELCMYIVGRQDSTYYADLEIRDEVPVRTELLDNIHALYAWLRDWTLDTTAQPLAFCYRDITFTTDVELGLKVTFPKGRIMVMSPTDYDEGFLKFLEMSLVHSTGEGTLFGGTFIDELALHVTKTKASTTEIKELIATRALGLFPRIKAA